MAIAVPPALWMHPKIRPSKPVMASGHFKHSWSMESSPHPLLSLETLNHFQPPTIYRPGVHNLITRDAVENLCRAASFRRSKPAQAWGHDGLQPFKLVMDIHTLTAVHNIEASTFNNGLAVEHASWNIVGQDIVGQDTAKVLCRGPLSMRCKPSFNSRSIFWRDLSFILKRTRLPIFCLFRKTFATWQ